MTRNEIIQRHLQKMYDPAKAGQPDAIQPCWNCKVYLSRGSWLCDYCRAANLEELLTFCGEEAARRKKGVR